MGNYFNRKLNHNWRHLRSFIRTEICLTVPRAIGARLVVRSKKRTNSAHVIDERITRKSKTSSEHFYFIIILEHLGKMFKAISSRKIKEIIYKKMVTVSQHRSNKTHNLRYQIWINQFSRCNSNNGVHQMS